jgi:PAS domain S-box-containing protein
MNPVFLADDEASRRCLQVLSAMLCMDGKCLCEVPEPGKALDLAGDAVMVVDANRRILHFNSRACELTGRQPEDVLGTSCREGLGCVDVTGACSLLEVGDVRHRLLSIRCMDGRERLLVKDGRALRDAEGNLVGAVESFHEITQSLLQASSGTEDIGQALDRCRMFESFTRDMEEGLVLTDRDGRVTCLSNRAEFLLGLPSRDALGIPLCSLVRGGFPDFDRVFEAVRNSGETAVLSGIEPCRPGLGRRLLTTRLMPVSFEDGTCEMVVVLRDCGALPDDGMFHGVIGRSPVMREVLRVIQKLAQRDDTVLLIGPSGSGKEVLARALHLAGPRASRPFHAFNCASLSDELLESELFGHQRGAFTGAVRDKPGRMELCGEGTLLLDEVGCLPLRIQAKLLRVLETREFERVGGTRPLRLRARIVAATNSDLGAMVRDGTFREDLYYRLRVVPLEVPLLRERREDIIPLARHFARVHGGEPGPDGKAISFSPEAVAALESCTWTGNIRELRNAIQYALAMGDGKTITVEDLPSDVLDGFALRRNTGVEPDGRNIKAALSQGGYRRAEAARILGISRTTLWRRMRQLGLDS